MATVTERQAKTQYLYREDGVIIGYSLKCASTFIYKSSKCIKRMGIHEAWEHKHSDENPRIVLVVRHPIDRLVSNYVFWRTVNKGAMKGLLANHPENGPVVHLLKEDVDLTIEEFFDYIERKYNAHWADQAKYHTYNGELVPNILYPIEALELCKAEKINPSPREGTWEDYVTPEFREQLEVRYADDIALYERAQAEWDGKRPKYF